MSRQEEMQKLVNLREKAFIGGGIKELINNIRKANIQLGNVLK